MFRIMLVVGWLFGLILFSTGSSFAAFISGPQIMPSTNMSVPSTDHTIDKIVDGISAASDFSGYYAGALEVGDIVLDLDDYYDLTAFYLWNDINVRNEGVDAFQLEFFNDGVSVGTAGPWNAGVGDPNMQTFTFPKMEFVNRVVVTIQSVLQISTVTRIEIREVALEGELSPPEYIDCCPPSASPDLMIEQFEEVNIGPLITDPTRLIFVPTTAFNQQMQWEINAVNAVKPDVTKLVLAFRVFDVTSGSGVQVGSTAYAVWEPDPLNVSGQPAAITSGFFSVSLQYGLDYEIQVLSGLEDANGSLRKLDYSPECRDTGGFSYVNLSSLEDINTNTTSSRLLGSHRVFRTRSGRVVKTSDPKPYLRKSGKKPTWWPFK